MYSLGRQEEGKRREGTRHAPLHILPPGDLIIPPAGRREGGVGKEAGRWQAQGFSTLSAHGSLLGIIQKKLMLGYIPRDSALTSLGCQLGIWIFQKSPQGILIQS